MRKSNAITLFGALTSLAVGGWWYGSRLVVQGTADSPQSPTADSTLVQAGSVSVAPASRLGKNESVIGQWPSLEGGALLASATDESGERRLYRVPGKYPLVKLTVPAGQPGRSVLVVADHLMVRFPAAFPAEDVRSYVAAHGWSIRGEIDAQNRCLVATPWPDLNSLDRMAAILDKEFNSGGRREVRYEPDQWVQACKVPNDPEYANQWALVGSTNGGGGIDAVGAWDLTTGSRSVVVAIVDSGVEVAHPDLASNLVAGKNFYQPGAYPNDDFGHGTQVAGVIGGVANNRYQVAGVNWSVSMMPLRFMDSRGAGTISDAVAAIRYAVEQRVAVINLSWSAKLYSELLHEAISDAEAAGILVVAAAGNDGSSLETQPVYPASYDIPNLVAVGATTATGSRLTSSNYGAVQVDLFAPGDNIATTSRLNSVGRASGTSVAAAFVSGTVALMRSVEPSLPYDEVKTALLNGVSLRGGMAQLCAANGTLNSAGALRSMLSSQMSIQRVSIDDTADGNGDGVLNPGEAANFHVHLLNRSSQDLANVLVETALSASNWDAAVGVGSVTVPVIPAGQSVIVEGLTLRSNAPGKGTLNFSASFGSPLRTATKSWPLTSSAATTTLSGIVVDGGTGLPSAGATVNYSGSASGGLTADASGAFSVAVPEGLYALTVTSQGYQSVRMNSVTLPSATALRIELHTPRYALTPTRLDLAGVQGRLQEAMLRLENSGAQALSWTIAPARLGSGAPGTLPADIGIPVRSGTVPAGASANIVVTYGNVSSESLLELQTDTLGALPILIPVKVVYTPPPPIEINPSALQFDPLKVGSETSQTLMLRNSSRSEVRITGMTCSSMDFGLRSALPLPVPAGASLRLPVSFAPHSEGDAAGELVLLTSSEIQPELRIPLTGRGVVEESLMVTPSEFLIAGPERALNSVTLQLRNNGTREVVWRAAALLNRYPSAQFKITPAAGELSPGAADTLTVSFDGGESQEVQALQVVINSNDPFHPETIVNGTLRCTARPIIDVKTSLGVDFGAAFVGRSARGRVGFYNRGSVPLGLGDVASSNPEVTLELQRRTVQPGGYGELLLDYRPLQPGKLLGTVSLKTNDPLREVIEIPVTGTATIPGDISIAMQPGRIIAPTGKITEVPLTVTNNGPGATTISAEFGSGSVCKIQYLGASELYTSRLPPSILAPGASTTIVLKLDATNLEERQFMTFLTVRNSGGAGSTSLALEIFVDGAPVLTTPSTLLKFEDVLVGYGREFSFVVRNTGTAEAPLSRIVFPAAGYKLLSELPATLRIGEAMTVRVQLLPTRVGDVGGMIQVVSPESTLNLPVEGRAEQVPQFTLSERSLKFDLPTGHTIRKPITITNKGTIPLSWRIDAVQLSPGNAYIGGYSQPWLTVNPDRGVVAPGATSTFEVITNGHSGFGSQSKRTGSLTIYGDLDRRSLKLPVTVSIEAAPKLTVLLATDSQGSKVLNLWDFYVEPNASDPAVRRTFSLQSMGASPVTIKSVTTDIPGASVVLTDGWGRPSQLPVQFTSSREIQLHLSNTDSGPVSGTITIESNDPLEPVMRVLVVGHAWITPKVDILFPPFSGPIGRQFGSSGTITNLGSESVTITNRLYGLAKSPFEWESLTVEPGESIEVPVRFDASAIKTAQTVVVDLPMMVGDSGPLAYYAHDRVAVTVVAAPKLSLSKTEITFPPTPADGWNSGSVFVYNSGQLPLNLSAVVSDTPSVKIQKRYSSQVATTIAPNGKEEYVITCRSPQKGPVRANISFLSDDPLLPKQKVAVSTEGLDAMLSVENAAFSFHPIPPELETQPLVITNRGSSQFTGDVRAFEVLPRTNSSGTPSSDLLVENLPYLSFQLAPGERREFMVSASSNKKAIGTYQRYLEITSSDPSRLNQIVIPVSIETTASKSLRTNLSELDFGSSPQGTKDISLSNAGSDPIIVSRLSLPGGPFVCMATTSVGSSYYSYVPLQLPLTLPRAAVIQIQCTFTAAASGPVEGVIEVESDAANAPLLRIPVKADGKLRASLTATPSQLDVDLDSNGATTRTVSLHNSGDLGADWKATVTASAAPTPEGWLQDASLESLNYRLQNNSGLLTALYQAAGSTDSSANFSPYTDSTLVDRGTDQGMIGTARGLFADPALGLTGRYVNQRGVFVAELDGVSSFSADSALGVTGHTQSAVSFDFTLNGRSYHVSVQRLWADGYSYQPTRYDFVVLSDSADAVDQSAMGWYGFRGNRTLGHRITGISGGSRLIHWGFWNSRLKPQLSEDQLLTIARSLVEATQAEAVVVSPPFGAGTLAGPGDLEIPIAFSAGNLAVGSYEGTITIAAERVKEGTTVPAAKLPDIVVPYTMNVLSKPRLELQNTELRLPTVVVGQKSSRDLHLSNPGNDNLVIDAIFLPPSPGNSHNATLPLVIPPQGEATISIEFEPSHAGDFSGLLRLRSNAFESTYQTVNVSAVAVDPTIQATVAPSLLVMSAPEGGRDTAELELTATEGPLVWKFTPVSTRLEDDPDIEQVLASLRANAMFLEDAIPDRYQFSGGESGATTLVDASIYRSGGGNKVTAALVDAAGGSAATSVGLPFSDWSIAGSGEVRYFTWKLPGMFGCVADFPRRGSFRISSESKNGRSAIATISMDCGGRTFVANVQRILGHTNAAHEIVIYESERALSAVDTPDFFRDSYSTTATAQSVIIRNADSTNYGGTLSMNGGLTLSSWSSTNYVNIYSGSLVVGTGSNWGNLSPPVTDLTNYWHDLSVPIERPLRVHEIVVAKPGGGIFSVSELRQLLATYLPAAHTRSTWLTVQPSAGVVSSGTSATLQVTADATALKVGDFQGALVLARQAASAIVVPVSFLVTEGQYLVIDKTELAFPTVAAPDHADLQFELRNPGSLPLVLEPATLDNPSFALTTSLPSVINPGQRVPCSMRFTPQRSGEHVGELVLKSSSLVRPVIRVALSGNATNPAHPVFDPGHQFTWEPLVGPTAKKTITLRNPGDTQLEWSFTKPIVSGISVSPIDGILPPGGSTTLTFTCSLNSVDRETRSSYAFPFVSNGYQSPAQVSIELHLRPLPFSLGRSELNMYRIGTTPLDMNLLRLPSGIPDQVYMIELRGSGPAVQVSSDAAWLKVPQEAVPGNSVPITVSVKGLAEGTHFATLIFRSELGEIVHTVQLNLVNPVFRGLIADRAHEVLYAWLTDKGPYYNYWNKEVDIGWNQNFLARIDAQTLEVTHTVSDASAWSLTSEATLSPAGGFVWSGYFRSVADLSVLPGLPRSTFRRFGILPDGGILATESRSSKGATLTTLNADLTPRSQALGFPGAEMRLIEILPSVKEDAAWVVQRNQAGNCSIVRLANLNSKPKIVDRTPWMTDHQPDRRAGRSAFFALSGDERWFIWDDERYAAKNLREKPVNIPLTFALAKTGSLACSADTVFDLESLKTIQTIPTATSAAFTSGGSLVTIDALSRNLRRLDLARTQIHLGANTDAPIWAPGQMVEYQGFLVSTTAERVLTISNGGASPLRSITATVTGALATMARVETPDSVDARKSGAVVLRMTPTVAGVHRGMLHLSSDDPINPVIDIPIVVKIDDAAIIPAAVGETAQIIEVGSGHSLAPSISGTMPMTAAWFKDGKAIRNATGSTLLVQSAKLTDAGLYRLDVKNQAGEASVTVPVIVKRQIGQVHDVVEGTAATLGSEVKGPVSSYQWLKDGEVVADSTAISGATTATLRLKQVAQDSAGLYQLLIKVGDRSAVIARHEVRITKKPIVTTPAMGPWVVGQSVAVLLRSEPAAPSYKATGLPPGLKLDAATGSLSGIPTKAGTYTISVTPISAAGAGPVRLYPVVVGALDPRLIGSFEGLQGRGYWNNDPLGGAVSISVSASASYSGVLRQGSVRIPFVGQLQAADQSADYVSTTTYKIADSVVEGSLRLDRANGAFSGWLRMGGGSAFTAIRNVTAAEVQKLNFVFEPTPEEVAFGGIPWGNSILSANVNRSGLIKGAGALADGTSVTFASRLAEGGRLPIYLSVKSSASLQGWLTSTDGPYTGTADWFRLPDQTGKAFSSGIGLHSLNSLGGQYQSPASGTDLFGDVAPANGYQIQLQGEVFSLQLPLNISLKGKGVFVNQPQSKFAFQPATGRFDASCQVLLDGVLQPAKIVGVVLPGQPLGTGWCLIPDGKGGAKSALVILEPLP